MTRSPAVPPESMLVVDGLDKVFSTGKGTVHALDSVSTAVAEGEFVALLGPSGCGKSTLLSIVGGLEPPSAGQVTVAGARVRGPLDEMGFVFQRDLLLEWRTALDNVLLQYEIRGMDAKPHVDEALELLASVGLDGFEHKFPWQLSGGMRQRVAICRALIHHPSVLFMDEPFGAVDALTRERLNEDLSRLCSEPEAKTVLFVTHDIDEAVFLADRVLIMSPRPGRIVAEQRIELEKPRVNALRGSDEFLRQVAQSRELLMEHGVLTD